MKGYSSALAVGIIIPSYTKGSRVQYSVLVKPRASPLALGLSRSPISGMACVGYRPRVHVCFRGQACCRKEHRDGHLVRIVPINVRPPSAPDAGVITWEVKNPRAALLPWVALRSSSQTQSEASKGCTKNTRLGMRAGERRASVEAFITLCCSCQGCSGISKNTVGDIWRQC